MHKRHELIAALVGLLTFLFVMAQPAPAHAFHTGVTFGERADEGGGGGIFYVAMPLERGWDCTMCHTDPPGRMKINIEVDPPSLFQTFRYDVGGEYVFTVDLVWGPGVDELGAASTRSNFNSLAVGAADSEGLFAGTLQGGGFVSGSGSGTIASEGLDNAQTRFTFRWFAPDEAGRGTVKLYFGAVDGNGADSPPDVTRTDPFGDDVFMAQVTLEEGGAAASGRPQLFGADQPSKVVRGVSKRRYPPSKAAFGALGLLLFLGRRRLGYDPPREG